MTASVEELERRLNELQDTVERIKTTTRNRITESRVEMKGYAAEILERLEGLQEQMDLRFDATSAAIQSTHARMDSVTVELTHLGDSVKGLVDILRNGLQSVMEDEKDV
jgi:DNA anti-recombination protein RmuC